MGIVGELFMLCRLFIGARVIEIVREFSGSRVVKHEGCTGVAQVTR